MEVTRCSLLSQLYSGYSSSFLVLFLAHRPLLAFTFESLLSSRARFWYLPTFSYSSSTLVSPGTAISIKSAVLLSSTTTISVVCVQSRCPSGYLHPVGFWLSPSLSLVQLYVGTIIYSSLFTLMVETIQQYNRKYKKKKKNTLINLTNTKFT